MSMLRSSHEKLYLTERNCIYRTKLSWKLNFFLPDHVASTPEHE